MSEKSGIQMLEEMQQSLELIERRFANLEFMMKELLNRANVGEKPAQAKPVIAATVELPKVAEIPQSCMVSVKPAGQMVIAKPVAKIGDPPVNSAAANPNHKIKILGQIKNKDGRFVSGVNVKVFDINNQMIKETRTNKAGEWMSLLPAGKYRAEYFLENIVSGTVNFNALPGQTMVRVAQPQKEG